MHHKMAMGTTFVQRLSFLWIGYGTHTYTCKAMGDVKNCVFSQRPWEDWLMDDLEIKKKSGVKCAMKWSRSLLLSKDFRYCTLGTKFTPTN